MKKVIVDAILYVFAFLLLGLAVWEFKTDSFWLGVMFLHSSLAVVILVSLSDCVEMPDDYE